ncbi:hypothetical protein [Sphingomonas nostoxanthinifaciens]|nr:hypothetical protein [Sphingomonas nostoxanthinifaciens]UAK24196.1 hypothetical protein K8P63_17995 [Sphingomonas nostoxanthinifaciens]UAK24359.1 hypothetical protein K8P63_18935 [Sphingomonas nostoxanthinifaciens]
MRTIVIASISIASALLLAACSTTSMPPVDQVNLIDNAPCPTPDGSVCK